MAYSPIITLNELNTVYTDLINRINVASIYEFKGQCTVNELKALTSASKGDVYDITDNYPSLGLQVGDNVVCLKDFDNTITINWSDNDSTHGASWVNYWAEIGTYMDLADEHHNGFMSTTNQAFAGQKTFDNVVINRTLYAGNITTGSTTTSTVISTTALTVNGTAETQELYATTISSTVVNTPILSVSGSATASSVTTNTLNNSTTISSTSAEINLLKTTGILEVTFSSTSQASVSTSTLQNSTLISTTKAEINDLKVENGILTATTSISTSTLNNSGNINSTTANIGTLSTTGTLSATGVSSTTQSSISTAYLNNTGSISSTSASIGTLSTTGTLSASTSISTATLSVANTLNITNSITIASIIDSTAATLSTTDAINCGTLTIGTTTNPGNLNVSSTVNCGNVTIGSGSGSLTADTIFISSSAGANSTTISSTVSANTTISGSTTIYNDPYLLNTSNNFHTNTSNYVVIDNGGLTVSGDIYGYKVHNAVWNDLVDCIPVPEMTNLEYGFCYCFDGKDYYRSTRYCEKGIIGIHSDTSGFMLGERPTKTLNSSVAGYVLAYVDKEYPVGTPLTCTKQGFLTKMRMIDRIIHPERIVATFWKFEEEDKWGPKGSQVNVNGRMWVKIR